MAEPHLDHPGDISWFKGGGPALVLGPCPHGDCRHLGTGVIGWGPSLARYEIVACGSPDPADESPSDCAMTCRAWVDSQGRTVTPWLHVVCCDLHGKTCEPPAELCCARCPEARHPDHLANQSCVLHAE